MIHLKQPLVLSGQCNNVVASPLFATTAAASSQHRQASRASRRLRSHRISCARTDDEASGVSTSETANKRPLTVTAIITAQVPNSVYVSRCFDDIQDLLGKTMLLELVSSELDPSESLLVSLNLT
jgi:lipoxygenase